MNIYSRLFLILLIVIPSILTGEDLILAEDSYDGEMYSLIVEDISLYRIGELFDVYSEREELPGTSILKGLVDTLVITEIEESSIRLEPLWYGADRNIQTGYFLEYSGRSIETETPDITKINENSKVVRESSSGNKIREGFSFDFSTGAFYDMDWGTGAYLGVSFFLGRSSIVSTLQASVDYLTLTGFDLSYNYNLPLGKYFELIGGMGLALDLGYLLLNSPSTATGYNSSGSGYYDSYGNYSSNDIYADDYNDFVLGLSSELGFRWRTGLFFDISASVKYCLYPWEYDGFFQKGIFCLSFDF